VGATNTPSTIPGVLAQAAVTWPDAVAIHDLNDGVRWTYETLWRHVEWLAAVWGVHGVEPGSRIALWADNSAAWAFVNLAILTAGATVVPLNPRWRHAEVQEVLAEAHCAVTITAGDMDPTGLPVAPNFDAALDARGAVADRLATVTPDTVSHVQFTSGTTGRPKGVMLTHGGMVRSTQEWIDVVGLRPGDRSPIVNPMAHIGGHKTGLLAALCAGATAYPIERFEASQLAELIDTEELSFLQGPPAMFQALLDAIDARRGRSPKSVRVAVTGSANIPPALVQRMKQTLGLDAVHTGYGLTEATGVCTITRADDPLDLVTRTSGRPIPGMEVRIAGATQPLDEGEIEVRGAGVMLGYLDDPDGTADAIDADGWLATGDVGFLDADGNLAICDRIKDMVIVGGFNAYPAEIERVLSEHDSVADAAVVGVPDDRLGEVPVAFVVRSGAVDAEGLIAWVNERLASYKVPRAVWFLGKLPLNSVPKVDKVALANVAREMLNRE
jgi:HIP---CoA ligase